MYGWNQIINIYCRKKSFVSGRTKKRRGWPRKLAQWEKRFIVGASRKKNWLHVARILFARKDINMINKFLEKVFLRIN